MVPVFAVVGRVNKGKSSMVASLTENDAIAISPEPGTTVNNQLLPVTGCDDEELFKIYDTPGFQQPEKVLSWLNNLSPSADQRPDTVSEFLRTFRNGDDFKEECDLLDPIMSGAYIIYVVDSSHRYSDSFECEMEILRWTGRPSMAVLNRIGDNDYCDNWRTALGQYFNIVKNYNAHKSLFNDRISLLSSFKELDENLEGPMSNIIDSLTGMHENRINGASEIIGKLLVDALTFSIKEKTRDTRKVSNTEQERFTKKYQKGLRKLEADARKEVEKIFNYTNLERRENSLDKPIFEEDLFNKRVWNVLGLKNFYLISGATALSAGAGAYIDLSLSAGTFMSGTIIGGAIGLIGSSWRIYTNPVNKIFSELTSKSFVVVGPHQNPNFPWIILNRALLHFQSIINRSHAERDTMEVPAEDQKVDIASIIGKDLRDKLIKKLSRLFKSRSLSRKNDNWKVIADAVFPVLRQL